jgi:hypothetical protein
VSLTSGFTTFAVPKKTSFSELLETGGDVWKNPVLPAMPLKEERRKSQEADIGTRSANLPVSEKRQEKTSATSSLRDVNAEPENGHSDQDAEDSDADSHRMIRRIASTKPKFWRRMKVRWNCSKKEAP